jgi:hypothetical protein
VGSRVWFYRETTSMERCILGRWLALQVVSCPEFVELERQDQSISVKSIAM